MDLSTASGRATAKTKVKMLRADLVFQCVNGFILIVITFLVLYPVWYAFISSFSDPELVARGQIVLLPRGFNLQGYQKVFQHDKIMTGYANTLLYTVVGTLINTTMTLLCAYPLSRADLWGRKWITKLIVFTMYFSGGLIPTYFVVRDLGLYNTMWALILPNCISVTNMIIMRTYFVNSVPFEMQEAGMLDGASNLAILIRIVLPLSMPVVSVILLYSAVGYWNSYFSALIYLSDAKKYPLQLVLRDILITSQMTDMVDTAETAESLMDMATLANSIKYAVVVVASVPMLILYPFIQKYFKKGIMLGAVKG